MSRTVVKNVSLVAVALVVIIGIAWWIMRDPAAVPPDDASADSGTRMAPAVVPPTPPAVVTPDDPAAGAPAEAPAATKPSPALAAPRPAAPGVTGTVSLARDGQPREPQPAVPIYLLPARADAARLAEVLAGQIKQLDAGVLESRQTLQQLPGRIALAKAADKRGLEQLLVDERAKFTRAEERLTAARAAHAALKPGTAVPMDQAYRTLRTYCRFRPSRFGDLARQSAVTRLESRPDGSFAAPLPPGPHFLFVVRNKPGTTTDYVEWLVPLPGDGKPLDLNETTATRQILIKPNDPRDVGLNDE